MAKQRATVVRTVSLVLACGLAMSSLSSVALAGGGQSLPLAGVDAGGRISVNGAVVHTAQAAVSDLRLSPMGSRGAAALTWTEGGAPKYAFSRDGISWSPAFEGEHATLRLRWQEFDPLDAGGNADAPAVTIPPHLEAGPEHRTFIVQFVVPPFDVVHQELEAMGAVVRAFLPDSAYIVEGDDAAMAAVRAMAGVRWVGAYAPAFKCEPALLRGYLPAFAAVDPAARAGFASNWERSVVERMEALGRGEAQSFWIQVWGARTGSDQGVVAPVKLDLARAIGAMGGTVQEVTPDDDMMRVLLTQEQLVQVLARSEVAFVDPWGPGGSDMDIERVMSGANTLETATGFSGEGVRGELIDSGLRSTHQAFSNPGPAPVMRTTSSASTSHGTSCFGIMFGDGSANAAGRGLLPDAEGKFFYSYNQLSGFGGTNSRLTITSQGVTQNQIVFQSNSFGSTLTTAYTTISQAMDQIIFQTGLLICQSQSNAGSQSSRPEAWAKNVLAVGGYNHFNNTSRTDDTAGSASRGPAADGRIKPELAHHYEAVLATDSLNDTSYTTGFGGTSAATPITCGYMGLIFQMWQAGTFPGFGGASTVFEGRPFFTTARALAIHSAFRYNWSGPAPINATINRNYQGWGSIDVANLLTLAPTLYVENEAKNLLAGQTASYTFDVAPNTPILRATMVFADPPGTVSATQHAINNLSLRVTGPTGTFWWGNNGLSASNWSTSAGTANVKDTVENVFLQNPAPGRYRVEVIATTVTQDSNPRTAGVIDASYALVVSGAQRTPVRVLTLDTARSGLCAQGGVPLSFVESPAFAQVRTWLADPRRFGGAGGLDRPVTLLPATNSLTPATLAGADVVVLTGPGATALSSCERTILRQFIQQGGGLLALDDEAPTNLAGLFGAQGGDIRAAGSLTVGGAGPVLTGNFGTVAGPVAAGTHRVFASLGASGTALLTSGADVAAARFALGTGRAVVVGDADWAADAAIEGCVVPTLPSTSNERFFLNALAFVAPAEPVTLTLGCCDSLDFNNDGLEQDPTDIEAFLSVYSGGPCLPAGATCNDVDFNNDGLEQDPTDIEAFLSVYSGGPCL